jgi:hypothetical protein
MLKTEDEKLAEKLGYIIFSRNGSAYYTHNDLTDRERPWKTWRSPAYATREQAAKHALEDYKTQQKGLTCQN